MMKWYFTLIAVVSLLFLGCADQPNSHADSDDLEALYSELDTLKNALAEEEALPNWKDFFQINIPEPMFEMDQLNQDAIVQYGYIEEVKNDTSDEVQVLEHYLIVMMETRAEMAEYETEMKWDATSYYHNVTQSLRSSKDRFDEVENEPKMISLNGLSCVRNEAIAGMEVRGEWIDLFYELAVFEGEYAFYQIITWCPLEQRSIFETDMELMIDSFKEKKKS